MHLGQDGQWRRPREGVRGGWVRDSHSSKVVGRRRQHQHQRGEGGEGGEGGDAVQMPPLRLYRGRAVQGAVPQLAGLYRCTSDSRES